MRKILHIDMDAFYASVEQRDDPSLRGRPVAVGGSSRRGVVAAASYEARAFGVHSAMPSALASRKCPDLIFVKSRFDVYRDVSRQVRDIFGKYTELVEPFSLDEAYLDVSDTANTLAAAAGMASEIKQQILERTGLTASAGVSFNKFLAKVGSDFDKPDGLKVVSPEAAPGFIARLPIEKFYGVGPATARKMHEIGVRNGRDLQLLSEEELVARFGKTGRYYFRIARCRDERRVRTSHRRKSIGAEQTFEKNISSLTELRKRLRSISDRVAERMVRASVVGRTVTLKIKYHNFEVRTRQTTAAGVVHDQDELFEIADLLLRCAPEPPVRPVRLLGISVSNLRSVDAEGFPEQLQLDFRRTSG